MSAAAQAKQEGLEQGREERREDLLQMATRVFSDVEMEDLRTIGDLEELSRRVMQRLDERLGHGE